MLKKLFIFFVMAVMLTLIDCRCGGRQVVLSSISLEIPTYVPGFKRKEDRERFSNSIKATFEQSPYFLFDNENKQGKTLRLLFIAPPEGLSDSVLLVASLEDEKDQEKKYQSFVNIKIIKGGINGNDVATSIQRASEELYERYKGSSIDKELSLSQIQKKLDGEPISTDEVLRALSLLNEAKEKEAIKPMTELLLKTNDPSVAHACIRSLGEMRAEQAMPAIIEFVERKPSVFRLQAIYAAKNIASKLAAEWLLVMAYGYNDPLVQKEAFSALESIEKKASSTTF